MDLLRNCSQCIMVGDNDIQTASKWQLTSNSQGDANLKQRMSLSTKAVPGLQHLKQIFITSSPDHVSQVVPAARRRCAS